jgi:NAD(P)-dependent dehydrogenase (short-subunit alcohol dehydrogenase family)
MVMTTTFAVGIVTALVMALITYFVVVQPIQRSRRIALEDKEIVVLTGPLSWGMIGELIAYLFTDNAKTVLPQPRPAKGICRPCGLATSYGYSFASKQVRRGSVFMDLHLRAKRALVTGASKGIGAAAAEAFAEEGCHLRLAARSKDALETLATHLRESHGVDVAVHVADLRQPADLQRLAAEAADIDILVNNAGDIPGGSLEAIDDAKWRHAWDLKVFGFINLARLVYAQMKQRGGGVIVNDIGAAGERFDANYICGSAGNAALMAFTRALGSKSLDDGIRVVGINPGPVGTDRHVTLMKTRAKNRFGDENRYRELQAGLPLGRPAQPREIADLMAYLASDRSAYTSGVIVTVDGGISAGWWN